MVLQIKIFWNEKETNSWLRENFDKGIKKEDIRVSCAGNANYMQSCIGIIYNE